jgi:rod shape-determining protein MreD
VTIYLVVPFLVVVALLQTTIVPHLTIWRVFPDVPAILVVCWGLLAGKKEGVVWGFVAGVAIDIFAGAPFGAATLALTVVGLLSGLGARTGLRANILLPMLAVFAATVVYGLIFMLVVQITGQTVAWLENLIRIVLPSAALNAVLTPLFFVSLRIVYNRFERKDMEW